jgi:hypothetical protein
MPGALIPPGWFTPAELAAVRLSSKSHWDLPIEIGRRTVHFLVSHPTPPTFDGPPAGLGSVGTAPGLVLHPRLCWPPLSSFVREDGRPGMASLSGVGNRRQPRWDARRRAAAVGRVT